MQHVPLSILNRLLDSSILNNPTYILTSPYCKCCILRHDFYFLLHKKASKYSLTEFNLVVDCVLSTLQSKLFVLLIQKYYLKKAYTIISLWTLLVLVNEMSAVF